MTSAFGPIVTKHHVEQAAIATLKMWLPTYLGELERILSKEPGFFKRPSSWHRRDDFEKWPEDMLPCILVVSPGLAAEPTRHGPVYHAPWYLGVAAIVSARDKESTELMSDAYGAAIRTLMVQAPEGSELHSLAEGVDWINERYDDLEEEKSRTVSAGQVIFEVEVATVTIDHAPPVPDPDPNNPSPESPEDSIIQRTEVIVRDPEGA